MGHDNIDFFGIMSRLTFCLLREMLRNEQIWKRWLPNATSFGGGTLKWDVEAMEIKKHRGIVPQVTFFYGIMRCRILSFGGFTVTNLSKNWTVQVKTS